MWFKQKKIKQVIWFTQQFALMHQAGMSFSMSLKSLIAGCDDKSMMQIIKTLLRQIERGHTFAQGLEKFPHIFERFYIEMIRVGEETGKLTVVLNELQNYYEIRLRFWQDILRAISYPSVVMLTMIGITFGLCLTIVPQFKQIFESFHAPLPWVTVYLFNMIDFISAHFILLLSFFILLVFCGMLWWKKQRQRIGYQALLLRLPLLGAFYQASLLLKFFRVLGISIMAGLSLHQSMGLLRKMFASTPFESLIRLIQYDLQQGRKLSEIFNRPAYFPGFCLGFIQVAEETGMMETQFFNLAGVFAEQIKISLERFKVLLEPLMMLFTGVLVGGVVLAIYYPIFSMGSAF